MIDSKKLALRIVTVAVNKKAEDITGLDLRKVCGFCDYFVILSVNSLKQANALAESIQEDLAKDKIKSLSRVSAADQSGWVALDFASVITHIFYKPMREFYCLERLWSDAKKMSLPKEKNAA
ncbi:MAG: ribosome silencing factor [Candidatus Omnitrophota bacterium]|nr:ribosome silencing factor [Candidatus Omnitrophota bacterium]MBU1928864.1 ribosome silencing factor [Candidatus Omnitrophota bacterium]MBU2034474.1 ribosome silencing factor [Candidatus Omnitrophota bacterium]MBU2221469.1 ribosome silencing factor [Candidatus Omnitrophota bacterium]MBU2258634.1 ribosome silencing factor [Candidatus Omnitrophota bacterium]